MSRHPLLSLIILLVPLAQPLLLRGQAERLTAADAAWERLTTLNAPRTERDAAARNQADWAAIAAAAKKFQADFRSHAKARSAAKLELTARISAEEGAKELSPEVATAVAAYLRDTANDVRDRLLLKVDFDQAKIRRAKPATYDALLQARAGHARELMRDFPEQPDGYGYMLSLARLAPPEQARDLAEQLLADEKAPDRFKDMAQRITERPGLLGQPLRLVGAEAEISRAVGKTLVIYSWRVEDEGFRTILQRMGTLPGVEFIGINLDQNKASVRSAARDLPGAQFYDGGGLDGPLAAQLKLVLQTSVYLVDGQGILRDLDAHRAPYDQLTRFLARTGGVR